MAEKYNDYYRVTWMSSGMHSSVTTKSQLLREIETSLLHLNEENHLTISINKYVMTEKQFKNRDSELKNYGYEETMN